MRLFSLLTVAALVFAPMSGLVCDVACRPSHSIAAAAHESGHEAHAGCHDATEATGPALGSAEHHCDHAVAVQRPLERLASVRSSASTVTVVVFATGHGADPQIMRGRPFVSSSPPRSSPFYASFRLLPLRI